MVNGVRSIQIRDFMIPVKIQCECGQRYAFDVEPVNGRMSSSIACPTCGVDGTVAANEIIARNLAAQSAPTAPVGGLRINATPRATSTVASTEAQRIIKLGSIDRTQAEHEARAKISWGDSPDAVLKFLMIQGFNHQEASELVQKLFKERMAATRANGIKKIILGGSLICVPIVALIFFLSIHVVPIRLMGIAIAIGLWGGWITIKGIFMIVAPKLESGDVAEQ